MASLLLTTGGLRGQTAGVPILACSTTQVADFARQVVGDRCEVRCVLAPGQDPHLYAITPNDVALVRDAHLLLANGLHLEGNDWMLKLGQDVGKSVVICTAGIQPLQIAVSADDSAISVPDPHAWFTPQNAAVYAQRSAGGQPDRSGACGVLRGTRGTLSRPVADVGRMDCQAMQRHSSRPADPGDQPRCVRIFLPTVRLSIGGTDWLVHGTGDRGRHHVRRRKATVESIRKFGVKAIFVETSVNPKLIHEIETEAGVEIGGKLYWTRWVPLARPLGDLLGYDARKRGDDCPGTEIGKPFGRSHRAASDAVDGERDRGNRAMDASSSGVVC